MKSTRTSALCLALLFALTSTAPAYAKGGGGGGGGGGRSSFSGGSGGGFGRSSGGSGGGFFKSPSSPPPPPVKYSAPPPPPAPVKQAPPPPPAPAHVADKPVEKRFFQNDRAPQGADKRAVEAQMHADSKKAFEEAKAHKAEANRSATPTTQSAPVPASVTPHTPPGYKAPVYDLAAARAARDAREQELARQIAAGQLRDREYRSRQVYGSYYNQPISVPSYYGGGYSDSYDNAYFWYWLMQSANRTERDRFIYDHQRDIDPRRLAEMQSAYPEISASLDAFKTQGVAQNSSYVPPAFAGNEDLLYGDSMVKGATAKASATSTAKWLWVILFLILLGFSAYYLLFQVKWKVRETYA